MPDDRPDDRPEPSIAGTAHYREAAGRDHHGPNYRGLPVLSFPGLHDHVRTLAQRHFPQEASVLDLGCGSGALSLRLADAGFRMSCADAVGEAFRLRDEMPFTAVDLNRDFAPIIGGIFPAITAVEIIEHLENPRHFLRQCRALLQPGGCLILTTPNIDNLRSVLSFVKTGCFKYFDDNAHRK
ncbi:MAG: class I SAM-dependent methyltransferase, partial [Rhodospirillales bacterium]